jgi:hypothetical protein
MTKRKRSKRQKYYSRETTVLVLSRIFTKVQLIIDIPIQPNVIKFVIDLRQVGGILRVLWFPPPIKLTATI